MLLLPAFAALGASSGWALGIVLAQRPARALGAFEFTRVQLIACAALMLTLCSVLDLWPSLHWGQGPFFAVSIVIGIVLGNLTMIAALRRGGPRRVELLLTLKAPLVAGMAFVWLGELPSGADLIGAMITLSGVLVAIRWGVSDGKSDQMQGPLWPVIALGFASALCHGIGFLVLKPVLLSGTDPMVVSAVRLTGAAGLISVVGLWPAAVFRPATPPTPGVIGQAIVPGVIGYTISSTLLLYAMAHFGAGIAIVLGSLSPVFVLPILWIKDRRAPRPMALLGALLAVLGTAIILLG